MESAGGKILIVSDDERDAQELAGVLSARGLTAHAAPRKSARGRVRELAPELVFLDLSSDRGPGSDLIRILRQESPTLLIVALDGSRDPEGADRAFQAGASDCIRKPVEPDELSLVLRRWHERAELEKQREEALHSLEARNRELSEVNEKLRASEERYREVFDNSTAGIVLLEVTPDHRFRVLSANPAVWRMTGIPASVAVGRFVEEIVPKETAEALIGLYRRCVETGNTISMDNTLEFPGGRRSYFTTIVPVRDAEGRVHRLIALPRDITEQEAAERALRESEHRYREVFESTSDGIFIVEVTPDQRYRLLAMNPAQARMLGVTERSVLGRFVEDYLSPEVAESVMADNRACIEAGRTLTLERMLDLPEGRRYFSTILIPVKDERGVTHRLIGVARDITEARRASEREHEHEVQLLQAAKLASLGTLVSGIAHEINNPNNFIRLNSQNLREFWRDVREVLDRAAEEDPALSMHGIPYEPASVMIDDLLSGIEEGSKRIEKLLINLRNYARGDEGDLTDLVDLNEVIGSAVMIVRNLIGKSTRSFSTHLAPSLPAVRGNYHQLEQVILNLVTNACQALCSRESMVAVSTSVLPDGSTVVLEVTDDGIGIPEADLDRIMDPFFTTKRAHGGSGLGLAVSYRIVQNHGGTMRFVSQPGHGTTARVLLPAAEGEL
jgi:PAS domain S-box-containing protein